MYHVIHATDQSRQQGQHIDEVELFQIAFRTTLHNGFSGRHM